LSPLRPVVCPPSWLVRTGPDMKESRKRSTAFAPTSSFLVRALIQDFIRTCATCQRNKTEQLHPVGLLQPLEVPSTVWADIVMDFIKGIHKVNGKSVVLTVVDRFSKYTHFTPLEHPYTTTTVARSFAKIVRLHGLSSSIISDCDATFTNAFWKELFRLSGIRLNMSTVFQPQTNGQSEAVNKIITINVPSLLVKGSPSPVGTLAAVGRILLQLYVPELPEDLVVPCRLR
jgi:hypothetical protein